jgi:ribosome-binding protein aMBF1 (putative translation factor)
MLSKLRHRKSGRVRVEVLPEAQAPLDHETLKAQLLAEDSQSAAEWQAAEVRRSLGAAVYKLRLQAGMSQADLARASGLDPATISKIEGGIDMPGYRKVAQIAQALGLPSALSFGEGSQRVDVWLNVRVEASASDSVVVSGRVMAAKG